VDKTEAKMLWLYVRETWPHYQLPQTEEELSIREQVWLDVLGDVDARMVRAVLTTMAHREFAPAPGQIREAVESALMSSDGTAAPDPDEAWREVHQAVGNPDMRDDPQWSHPAIGDAVRAMGWKDYRMSQTEAEGTWRAHFLRFYETARKRHRTQMGLGLPPAAAVLELAPALRMELQP
jgi:hypothetical protein